jgi:RES domain-containing protein
MAEGQGHGVASFLPRNLHIITVHALQVLDLTVTHALQAVGLTIEDIQAADQTPCQRVGQAAHFLGFQGIRAPSATGIGYVIAAFEPQLSAGQLELKGTHDMDAYLQGKR